MLVTVNSRNRALNHCGHLACVQMPPATHDRVVVKSPSNFATRTNEPLTRVSHANNYFAVDLVYVDFRHLPRGRESKDPLVKLSAVHARKLPSKTSQKTACSTHFAGDPKLFSSSITCAFIMQKICSLGS